ncbi:MAG: sigma-70 family RNA polymerase sigma factor [Planctomycetota bacterium]
MHDDFEVLERFRSGDDPEALAILVGRYREMVYAVCRRRLSPLDAEDATQETFLKLVRNPGQVQTSVCAWLHTVATTTAVDWGRRETRALRSGASRNEMLKNVASGEEHAMDESELRTELDQAVAGLDEPFRILVVEHFLGGRTQSDLAAEQGCSVATVSRRVSKAVEMIKERLNSRGYTTATAAGLVGLLSTQANAADLPAGLTLRILGAANGSGAGGTAASFSSPAAAAATPASVAGGFSLPSLSVLIPTLLGFFVVIAMGLWLFTTSSPAKPTLPQTTAPGARVAADPSPPPTPPPSTRLRVGWIMDGVPGDITNGTPVFNEILRLSSDDQLDLVLLVPRQKSPEFEGILGFMGVNLTRRYFETPDALAGIDVLVMARALAEESDAAQQIWAEASTAWQRGVGTVLLAPQLPDTPEAREMALVQDSVAFHHPEGHGQRMSATVLQSHAILGAMQPGDQLDVCACGAITELVPDAQVLAMRNTDELPVAQQAADANLASTDMPLLVVHDPGDTQFGRRVIAPMNNYSIRKIDQNVDLQFLKRAILWAGRQPIALATPGSDSLEQADGVSF